jgi:hypothetical protein
LSQRRLDLGLEDRADAADYPDPASMLNSILRDSSVGPTFDDPAYQRKLAAAERLSGPERYLMYGRLDLELARTAGPLAAFDKSDRPRFLLCAHRLSDLGINGIDLAALCIKRTHRQAHDTASEAR